MKKELVESQISRILKYWIAVLSGLFSLISRFVFSFTGWRIAAPNMKSLHGIDYVENGSDHLSDIGVPFDYHLRFSMTREREGDKVFKSLGFRGEFQTGSAVFDGEVYISCDQPVFHQALKENAEARELILQFFKAGCERIWTDGKFLYIKHRFTRPAGQEELLILLDKLRMSLELSITDIAVSHKDSFSPKILLARVVIWSCAAYSAIACINFIVNKEDYHLDMNQLRLYGALTAVAIAILFFLVAFIFLRRSSYAHRLFMLETGFLVVFSVPILGIQGVSDLNRKLDNSPPIIVDVTVSKVWRERGGRLGFVYSPFHMSLVNSNLNIEVSQNIHISRKVFSGLHDHKRIQIEIGSGALGIPWYRKIDGVDMRPN